MGSRVSRNERKRENAWYAGRAERRTNAQPGDIHLGHANGNLTRYLDLFVIFGGLPTIEIAEGLGTVPRQQDVLTRGWLGARKHHWTGC